MEAIQAGQIRDKLLKDKLQQGKETDERQGYVNGVLDFFNEITKEKDGQSN